MAARRAGVLPMKVTHVGGTFRSCESCSIRIGKYRVELKTPAGGGVTHYMCERCKDGVTNR